MMGYGLRWIEARCLGVQGMVVGQGSVGDCLARRIAVKMVDWPGWSYCSVSGRVMRKFEPLPRSLCRSRWPWCSSMILRHMGSPSPLPPGLVVK